MTQFEQTTLADLSIVRQITNSLGGGTKKNFGQNFLINQNSLLKFVNSIAIQKDDIVVEIGPGIGVVSYTLCQRAHKVYLIEIDRDKEKALDKTLQNFDNYEILWQDAAKINWQELYKKIVKDTQKTESDIHIKIIGSLPYNVAKLIIYNFLTTDFIWDEASFFVQREVAENYTSQPPKAEFLSNFAQIYSDVTFLFGIPSEHFYPQPKVKTGVIHFIPSKRFQELDRPAFNKFIKQGFEQPRKTLANNLKGTGVTGDDIEELGLQATARPSELTIQQWAELFTKINKSRN